MTLDEVIDAAAEHSTLTRETLAYVGRMYLEAALRAGPSSAAVVLANPRPDVTLLLLRIGHAYHLLDPMVITECAFSDMVQGERLAEIHDEVLEPFHPTWQHANINETEFVNTSNRTEYRVCFVFIDGRQLDNLRETIRAASHLLRPDGTIVAVTMTRNERGEASRLVVAMGKDPDEPALARLGLHLG